MARLPRNNLVIIILLSLALKFSLFGYMIAKNPSLKIMPDTPTYVEPGINLMEKGVFGKFNDDGGIEYEINRTPGYPLFIGVLSKIFRLSFNQIIAIQLILLTFAGYLIYKACNLFNARASLLAAFIFLFDQPTNLAGLMLLTEALYAFFMAVFIYLFLGYLKKKRTLLMFCSAVAIAIATYIRPVSYYIGFCLAGGILYALSQVSFKRALAHSLVFLVVFYSLIGLWHYRNFIHTGNADFTVIDNRDLQHMGITNNYGRAGGEKETGMGPVRYYALLTSRSIVQFFTLPGTFKYFKALSLRRFSKIFGYPWVAFWLIGLFLARYKKINNQFLLMTLLYFLFVSVLVTGLCVGSRFRVPVMPVIAILSADGLIRIKIFIDSFAQNRKI